MLVSMMGLMSVLGCEMLHLPSKGFRSFGGFHFWLDAHLVIDNKVHEDLKGWGRGGSLSGIEGGLDKVASWMLTRRRQPRDGGLLPSAS